MLESESELDGQWASGRTPRHTYYMTAVRAGPVTDRWQCPESIFGTRSTDKVTTVRNPRYTVQYVQRCSGVLLLISFMRDCVICDIDGVGVGKSVRALSPRRLGLEAG